MRSASGKVTSVTNLYACKHNVSMYAENYMISIF